MKKHIIFFFGALSFSSAFTLNVNLPNQVTVPLNQQQTDNKTVEKNETKIQKPVKQDDNGNTKYIVTGNTKVVGNDDLDKIALGKPSQNICEAFVSENGNGAFDYGYEQGKKYTDLFIGKILVRHKKSLDILFPLQHLYIEGILEPPAIVKDTSEYTYDNGMAYKSYGVRYKIVKPARFVTKNTKKTWENFILTNPVSYYQKVKTDFDNLSFKYKIKWSNDPVCNKKIYNAVIDNFKKGFKQGEKEVQMSYTVRLKKLHDYLNELYLYNELYYKRIVNPPVIGEFTTPVYKTKDGQTLVIDENYYQIVKPARFNTQTKKWKVFLINHSKLMEIR